jgi:uncharacterized protein
MKTETLRWPELDVLRGFALFGILMVNFPFFAMPEAGFGGYVASTFPSWWDRAAHFVIQWLFDGKFVLIFSFLFGWGLHTQMSRGADFKPRYLRRMIGLFLIGLAHAVFLFVGDILVTYAVVGLVLLKARDWPVRKLIHAAAWMWLLTVVSHAGLGYLLETVPPWTAEEIQRMVDINSRGTFSEILSYRMVELMALYAVTPFLFAPQVLGAFFVGLAAAKTFANQGVHSIQPHAREIIRWLTIPALAANAAYAALSVFPHLIPHSETLSMLGRGLFTPLLTAVYMSVAVLLLTGNASQGLARLLGGEGRISLSVYVGESVLAGLVVYSYGLGLYGQIGPAFGIFICVLIYVLLVVLGNAWLSAFKLGPLEWILRSITEARFMPMMRESAVKPP